MATLDDVSNALASFISAIVYPNGLNSSSVANKDIQIVDGWPDAKHLDDYVTKSGNLIVSVYPSDIERNTTRGLGNQYSELSNNGTVGSTVKEIKRQERQFQISVWANNPQDRGQTSGIIDAALSDVFRLPLADSTVANISYSRSTQIDKLQNEDIYRLDLFYQIEFATTKTEADYVVQQNTFNITQMLN